MTVYTNTHLSCPEGKAVVAGYFPLSVCHGPCLLVEPEVYFTSEKGCSYIVVSHTFVDLYLIVHPFLLFEPAKSIKYIFCSPALMGTLHFSVD